jgi:hypothetical protein
MGGEIWTHVEISPFALLVLFACALGVYVVLRRVAMIVIERLIGYVRETRKRRAFRRGLLTEVKVLDR